MTKEEYAQSCIKEEYDYYIDWLILHYDVDDIDEKVIEKVIKDAIYECYPIHLFIDSFEFIVLGEENCDSDDWMVDDYDILRYDIESEIKKGLGLD